MYKILHIPSGEYIKDFYTGYDLEYRLMAEAYNSVESIVFLLTSTSLPIIRNMRKYNLWITPNMISSEFEIEYV